MFVGNDLGLPSTNSLYAKDLDFLGALSFGEVLEDTRQGKSVDKKFLKISDFVYQVSIDDSFFSDQESENLKKDVFSEEKSRYSLADNSSEDRSLSSDDSSSPSQPKESLYYGLALNLVMFEHKSSFLSKLPDTLRNFINETVHIMKSKDLFQDTMYKFTFKELDLTVLLKEVDDRLIIRVEFSQENLKDTLFTEDNNKLLLQALKKELSDDTLELEVVYTEAQSQESDKRDSDDRGDSNDGSSVIEDEDSK